VKTQGENEVRYRHTLDAIRTIYRNEGIRAFYRGIFPSLLGIFHVAVQFPLYEELKIWANRKHPEASLTSSAILACSGASKMVASIATYPHEVVRTRLQIQRRELAAGTSSPGTVHPGVVQTVRNILTREGWRGLYKGLSVNLLRTVPNSAVTMLTYELLMRYLSHH
jgi:solute carrier family 25 folate transporter 32